MKFEYICVQIEQIHVLFQEPDETVKDLKDAGSLEALLEAFNTYAFKFNGACDAEYNSFDVMILLTGNMNFTDVAGSPSKFHRYHGH